MFMHVKTIEQQDQTRDLSCDFSMNVRIISIEDTDQPLECDVHGGRCTPNDICVIPGDHGMEPLHVCLTSYMAEMEQAQ